MPQRFGYRCLPLTIGNQYGWEILSSASFEVTWDSETDQMNISDSGDGQLPVDAHFGPGLLTFYPGFVFRTDPGINLYIAGPANRPKDGIHPLTAVLESDWASYGFSMTWIITRKDYPIRFSKGEPFCRVFPIQRDLVESSQPQIRSIDDDPEIKAQFELWRDRRRSVVDGSGPVKWDKGYMMGANADGAKGSLDHQMKLKLKPFKTR